MVEALVCERPVRMGGRLEEESKWEKSPRGDGGRSCDPGCCVAVRLLSNSGDAKSSGSRDV